jgi:uncharacterized membrane protein YjfL (UPF0719 family)
MNWWQLHGNGVISAIVFSFVGLVTFGLFFWMLPKLLPFSLKKEILEDENTALGIVIGAIVLGMAFIIGHAIS